METLQVRFSVPQMKKYARSMNKDQPYRFRLSLDMLHHPNITIHIDPNEMSRIERAKTKNVGLFIHAQPKKEITETYKKAQEILNTIYAQSAVPEIVYSDLLTHIATGLRQLPPSSSRSDSQTQQSPTVEDPSSEADREGHSRDDSHISE